MYAREIRYLFFFFSSRRRHTRYWRDWSSDVCSSDLSTDPLGFGEACFRYRHLELTACVALVLPVAVEYAVDEARRIVYLRRARSEERRVGKECRSRWSPDH